MAIDAELNAGIIDEPTATARRVKVQKEADFYGAMDGASKFVRGDAVAGIIITLVNVIGGFAVGVLQMDLSLGESLQKFTLLSIGDGLVSQIPALIISVGASILVTRADGQQQSRRANRRSTFPISAGAGDCSGVPDGFRADARDAGDLHFCYWRRSPAMRRRH